MSTYRDLINEIYIHGYELAEDAPTFRVPENFDRFGRGKGWEAYRGENDWEKGTTGVAIYLNPEGYNKDMARIWFEVKFPSHLEEYVSSSKHWSSPSSKAVKKWGDKAARRWMRETVNIRRATKQFHGAHDGYPREWVERKTWKECFMLALESEKMKPFVKKWGVDKTKWVGMKRCNLNESGLPSKYWWMDRNGELIPVGPEQHAPMGRQILGLPSSAGVYQEMYDEGYLRVAFTGYWGSYQVEINHDPHKKPSLTQWRALKDLAIEMGAEAVRDNTDGKLVRVDESRLLFENFHENKEWFMYEGANTITAVFEDNSRQTFKVHFRDNRIRDDRDKHRKRAASTWKRLAMEIRKSAGLNRAGNPIVIPWPECFQRALQDPLMKEYIDDLRAVPIFESWMPIQNYWLAPNGIATKVISHEQGASSILRAAGKEVKGMREAYAGMYQKGYARIIIGDMAHPLIVDTGDDAMPKLTKAQRQWVEDRSFDLGLDGEYSNAYGRTMQLESGALYEMTYDELRQSMKNYKTKSDLRKGTTTGSEDRERGARNVNVRSLRVISTVGKDGDEHETSMFSYKSSNPSGDPRKAHRRWQGHIRFIGGSTDGVVASPKDKQDVEVNCTCPDYKYVWAKANSDADAGETGKTTSVGIEPKSMQYKTQIAPGEKKPVNIFEVTDDYGIQQGEPVDVDKRWKFQGGNTNNGTYGKRIRNPQNTPGLCIAKGELVSTNRGFIPIENIIKDDMVWTLDGWKKVIASQQTGTKSVIEIKLSSGNSIKLTPEHKVLCFNEERGINWIEAKLLTSKDFLCLSFPFDVLPSRETIDISEYKGDKLYYPNRTIELSPELAELMGYMIAEGSQNGIFSNFNIKLNQDFYNKWCSIFGNESCILRKEGCYVGTHGDVILARLGFVNGSYFKVVPDWILKGNKSIVTAFLRGCYAGDGNFRNHHSTYATVSEKLARNIQLLTNFIGVRTTLKQYRSGINNSLTWVVRTSSKEQTTKLYNIINPIRGYSASTVFSSTQKHFSQHDYIVTNGRKFIHNIINQSIVNNYSDQIILLTECSNYFNWVSLSQTDNIAALLKKRGQLKKIRTNPTGKKNNAATLHDIFEVLKPYYIRKIKHQLELGPFKEYKVHRQKLIPILNKLKILCPEAYEKASLLARMNVSFDKVDKIQHVIGLINVYDLKVDKSEHFTINGAIVHNCKHLIALAEYIEKEASPVAPEKPGKEEPSPVVPEKPSKLKKTGKPINIFEAIKQFAISNPTFDVPYED